MAVRKALDGRAGKKRRQRIPHAQHDSENDDTEDVEMGNVASSVPSKARGQDRNSPIVVHDVDTRQNVIETKPEPPAAQPGTSVTVGSALRRNPDGSTAMPVVVKRQPKAPRVTRKVSYSQSSSSPED